MIALVEEPRETTAARDADDVWHEVAQLWRSEDGGQRLVAYVAATPEVRARRTIGSELAPATASRFALGFDATRGETILRLYRTSPRSPDASARVIPLEGTGHWWVALPDDLPEAVAALTAQLAGTFT